MDPRTDEELLADAVRAGAAFAEFYRRHVVQVLIYFRRRTGDAEAAADLTAEVFAGALEGLARFDPARGAASQWLYGIARRQYIDYLREGRAQDRARRRLAIEPLNLTDEALARIDDLVDPVTSRALERSLADLPTAQREVVEAHVLHDESYASIAAREQSEVPAVRQRVSRALRALRQNLGKAP